MLVRISNIFFCTNMCMCVWKLNLVCTKNSNALSPILYLCKCETLLYRYFLLKSKGHKAIFCLLKVKGTKLYVCIYSKNILITRCSDRKLTHNVFTSFQFFNMFLCFVITEMDEVLTSKFFHPIRIFGM